MQSCIMRGDCKCHVPYGLTRDTRKFCTSKEKDKNFNLSRARLKNFKAGNLKTLLLKM